MKKIFSLMVLAAFSAVPTIGHSSTGVAIQRVIVNTRSELGQLASSAKAQDISGLMQKFDTQYQTWNSTCGGDNFMPGEVSGACKGMADQMRLTGIALYGKLADYLPDVAARYEQGGKAAKAVLDSQVANQSPAELYRSTLDGISENSNLGSMSTGEAAGPFDLEMSDFPDPTDQMFSVLEKLVPDIGKEIPETVRAGNTYISMAKKGRQARYLAGQFSKAKFFLEGQQEYGEIIFNATQAVASMPQVLGIQYTGTLLSAKPNRKVLDYYNKTPTTVTADKVKRQQGGFEPRS